MDDQTLLKAINEKYLTKNKRINTKLLKKDTVLIDSIYKKTSFLEDNTSIPERLYCITNNIKKKMVCPVCGKELSFFRKEYKDYCSDICYKKHSSLPFIDKITLLKNKDVEVLDISILKKELFKMFWCKKEKVFKYNTGKLLKIGTAKDTIIMALSIYEYTKHLDEKVSLRERVYLILHDIKDIPTCKMCNNNTKFDQETKSYRTYCSPHCMSKDPDYIEKKKKAMIDKYGIDNMFKNTKKIRQSIKDKYGVDNVSKIKEINEKQKKWHRENREITSKKKIASNYYDIIKRIENNPFSEVIPLFKKEEYSGRKFDYEWKCAKCGHLFVSNLDNGKYPRCIKCHPHVNKVSSFEDDLYTILTEKGLIVQRNVRFYYTNKNWYEVDLLLPDYNLGIEINGLYYHSETYGGKDKNYHLNKSNFLLDKNIFIMHIDTEDYMKSKDIIISMILTKSKKTHKRIFARKCTIKEVSPSSTKEFLNNNHIQGNVYSNIRLGMYYQNSLVAVMTFSTPRFNKKYDFELVRFCSLQDHSVIGGFSKLLSYFVKNYKPKSLVSYADRKYSKGDVYLKNGFYLDKENPPSYSYLTPKDSFQTKLSRIKFQKHKLSNLLDKFDASKSEWENMKDNGYDRIWDCGTLTFVKTF